LFRDALTNDGYREALSAAGKSACFLGFLILDNASRMHLLESAPRGQVSRRENRARAAATSRVHFEAGGETCIEIPPIPGRDDEEDLP
jgi:hypothetical protein